MNSRLFPRPLRCSLWSAGTTKYLRYFSFLLTPVLGTGSQDLHCAPWLDDFWESTFDCTPSPSFSLYYRRALVFRQQHMYIFQLTILTWIFINMIWPGLQIGHVRYVVGPPAGRSIDCKQLFFAENAKPNKAGPSGLQEVRLKKIKIKFVVLLLLDFSSKRWSHWYGRRKFLLWLCLKTCNKNQSTWSQYWPE